MCARSVVVVGPARHGRSTLFDRMFALNPESDETAGQTPSLVELCCRAIGTHNTLFDVEDLRKRLPSELHEPIRGTAHRLFDRLLSEHENGVAGDFPRFRGRKHAFEVTDASGHLNFLKNLIVGTTKPDCLAIVVSAKEEDLESAFSENGSLLAQASLALELGVRWTVVAVTKLDAFPGNRARDVYSRIERRLRERFRQIGFSDDAVTFVPVSGLRGVNLAETGERFPWHEGRNLLEAFDSIPEAGNLADKPLRIPIQDVYKIGGLGTVPTGRLESGVLRRGTIVRFAPTGIEARVRSVETHRLVIQDAFPGDHIGFSLGKLSVKDVARGHVAGEASNDPPGVAVEFTGLLVVLDRARDLISGDLVTIDCHTARVRCAVSGIEAALDRRTGVAIDQSWSAGLRANGSPAPWCESTLVRKSGRAARVVFAPQGGFCIEPYRDYPRLGRFVVREGSRVRAVGVVISVVKSP